MDNYAELEQELNELEPSEEELANEEPVEEKRILGGGGLHSLDLYLDEIYQTEMVPQEVIDEWANKRDEATTEAESILYRNKIWVHNLRLVVSMAKIEKDPEKLMDLISAGNIGLSTAAQRYDPSKGFKFSTFATWWIRQAINRERDNMRESIRLPVHAVEKFLKIMRYRDDEYKKTSKYPSISQISKEFKISPQNVTLLLMRGSVDSLDRGISEDEDSRDTSFLDMIPDSSVNVEQEVIKRIEMETLDKNLQRLLQEREYQIIQMRFGLGDEEPKSLQEVGEVIGVTRERVRQIESKALRKLRQNKSFRRMYRNIA